MNLTTIFATKPAAITMTNSMVIPTFCMRGTYTTSMMTILTNITFPLPNKTLSTSPPCLFRA